MLAPLTATAMFAAIMLCGCSSLGVHRIEADRDAYSERLRESEKAQLLTNIVALRFGDAPQILRVTSVINQYTREASGALSLSISPGPDAGDGVVGGNVLLRETPTITYTPIAGEAFAHSMLAPIPPASLVAMMESGWVADDLLLLTARSINGVRSNSRAPLFAQQGNPNLGEVFAAFRRLQHSGALNMNVIRHDDHFSVQARVASNLSEAERADLEFMRHALNAPMAGGEAEIVFSNAPPREGQIAIATRTMLEVLAEIAQGVDLDGDDVFETDAIVRIHSGATAPANAYAAIRRRGRAYWIAADDD